MSDEVTLESLASQVAALSEENRKLAGAVDGLARTVSERVTAEPTPRTPTPKPEERGWFDLTEEERTSFVNTHGVDAARQKIDEATLHRSREREHAAVMRGDLSSHEPRGPLPI